MADSIRSRQDVQHSDDEVRYYRTDGHLYAYREDDEHVVVSNGREPTDDWTKRVPAERTAVVEGEQLWTIPDNWDHRVKIEGAGKRRYAIYHIPETDVDVLVTVPHKNHLVDAWYGVKRVGELSVTYDDEIDWNGLADAIDNLQDVEAVGDDVVDALETLYHRRRRFERDFAELVDEHAERALFERAHEPVSIQEWTTDPWGDVFYTEDLLEDHLDVDDETLAGVQRELSEGGHIPHYPTVSIDVEAGAGVPDGYETRALMEAGCTPAEAVDYQMVELYDHSQTAWAEISGRDQSTVSENVGKASRRLEA